MNKVEKEKKEMFTLTLMIIGIGFVIANIINLMNIDIPNARYLSIDKSTISIGPSVKHICLNSQCNVTDTAFTLAGVTIMGSSRVQLGSNIVLDFSNKQLSVYNTATSVYYFKGTIANNTLSITGVPCTYALGMFESFTCFALSDTIVVYNVQFVLLDNISRQGVCMVSPFSSLCLLNDGPLVLNPALVTQQQLTNEWEATVVTPYTTLSSTLYGTKCLPYLLSSTSATIISITSYNIQIGYVTPTTVTYQLKLIPGINRCIPTTSIPLFPTDATFICFPAQNCNTDIQADTATVTWWGSNTNNNTIPNSNLLHQLSVGVNQNLEQRPLLLVQCNPL